MLLIKELLIHIYLPLIKIKQFMLIKLLDLFIPLNKHILLSIVILLDYMDF